ncbi:triple QxxK/R motif-containing protein [Alligator mississippiensis]|uniref:Triple QxxK/R motif-containing protein n=1 Tax=Alligator mississippiensis TaxID=8496 RepID=A0A151MY14_ALLMI|nr:triple QxxK/R motif-containing protein [Alligator mississippiensis]
MKGWSWVGNPWGAGVSIIYHNSGCSQDSIYDHTSYFKLCGCSGTSSGKERRQHTCVQEALPQPTDVPYHHLEPGHQMWTHASHCKKVSPPLDPEEVEFQPRLRPFPETKDKDPQDLTQMLLALLRTRLKLLRKKLLNCTKPINGVFGTATSIFLPRNRSCSMPIPDLEPHPGPACSIDDMCLLYRWRNVDKINKTPRLCPSFRSSPSGLGLKKMGRKDASAARSPVEQYRKQIGKQDYKKTKPMLRATRLKAEAKKTAVGIKEVALVLVAILVFLLAFYAFFYLNLSNEVDLDLDPDEN